MPQLLLEGIPSLLLVYAIFAAGQFVERRRHRQEADPRPAIQSLRRLLASDPMMPNEYQLRRLEAHDALAKYDQVSD